MTVHELKGFKHVDINGVGWEIVDVVRRDDHSDYDVTIQFNNHTKQIYTASHVIACINKNTGKSLNSIKAIKSPYDYIGRTFTTKHGRSLAVKSINKLRYNYKLTLVNVVWDDGTESVVKLNNIFKGTAKQQREIKRRDSVTITNNYKDSNGGYCKLPDGMESITVEENILNLHKNMMKRCYNDRTNTVRNESYKRYNVEVDRRWHNVYNFIEWCKNHYVEGYHLDKDLKGDGLLYGPNTCMFIPPMLNVMITTKPSDDKLPIGIFMTKLPGRKPYPAALELLGTKISLGYHDTIIGAFTRVKIIKEYIVQKVSEFVLTEFDVEIKDVVKSYTFKDIRKNDAITQNDVITHMKLNGGAISSDNYNDVKKAFISSHKDEFDKIFNKINVVLNGEFSRP